MKKIFFLYGCIFLLAITVIHAQDKSNSEKIQSLKEKFKDKDTLHFYFKLNGGYALPLAVDNISDFVALKSYFDEPPCFCNIIATSYQPINEHHYSYNTINVSLGKGYNIYGSFGIKFGKGKKIGIEIGGGHLWSSSFSVTENSILVQNSTSTLVGLHTRTLFAKKYWTDASFILFHKKNKVSFYEKLGILFSIPKVYYHETIEGMPFCGAPYNVLDWEYYGGFALGANASVVGAYHISKKIEIFGEVKVTALSYSPKKGKMINYTINNINKVDSLPINETNINFVNTISWDNKTSPLATAPTQQLKYHFPFSSWGINVGVKINLQKTYYRKKKNA